jgi:CheY-like chemotaxis protein
MKTLRVLIIEDHRDTADTLAKWVMSAGHAVQVCCTGLEAEQAAPTYHPDVVLLDIGLPDMDGWELASWLRQQNPSLTIAAVTAYQSIEDHQKSKDFGIDLHIGKPVHRRTILRLLDSVAG